MHVPFQNLIHTFPIETFVLQIGKKNIVYDMVDDFKYLICFIHRYKQLLLFITIKYYQQNLEKTSYYFFIYVNKKRHFVN